MDDTLKWLEWGRRLAAIAQTGETFAKDPFDLERYGQIREIAAEILAAGAGGGVNGAQPARVLDLLKRDSGYATPKLDVRAVVFRVDLAGGRILMVREKLDGNRWTLPGGWVDVGDAPGGAAERECLEETGHVVEATEVLAVWDRDHPRHKHPPILHHSWKVFIRCEERGEPVRATDGVETGEARFFSEAEVRDLDLSEGRITQPQMAYLFERCRGGCGPAGFD